MSNSIGPHCDKQPKTPFGWWLYRGRVAANLSVSQLAAMIAVRTGCDCNIGRISEWQQGKKRLPNAHEIAALEAILYLNGPNAPVPTKAPSANIAAVGAFELTA